MKYLKKYNESINSYQEITTTELFNFMNGKNIEYFNDNEVNKIENILIKKKLNIKYFFLKYKAINFGYNDSYYKYIITKFEDEYYILTISPSKYKNIFYKCDQLNELLDLLNSKL